MHDRDKEFYFIFLNDWLKKIFLYLFDFLFLIYVNPDKKFDYKAFLGVFQ